MSTKISQLTSATDVTANDLIQIVDVEDGVMAPSGTNKKATASLLAKELAKQPLEPGVVISGSSSSDAVRITQTGSGNALVVEDSTNPDSTPLVVNQSGVLTSGNLTPASVYNIYTAGQLVPKIQIQGFSADASSFGIFQSQDGAASGLMSFAKSRGSVTSPTEAQVGDLLGVSSFQGYDGAGYQEGASLNVVIDQPVATGDVSAAFAFLTNPAGGGNNITERMRITSAGNVGIGTSAPGAKLNVVDNSANDALRITQTSSGNALVVEDSTNPDSTPFVVDNNGRVIIGDTTSRTGPYGFQRGLQITNTSAQLTFASDDQFGNAITFAKSRGTPSSPDVSVQSGDVLGSIAFTANDGNGYVLGSQITSSIDGVAGSGDIPSCLTFGTSADGTTGLNERMRITSSGNVGIGTTSPSSSCLLHLSSTTSGFRPPSMTTAQRDLIATPIAGLMIYNNTTNKLNFYNGSAWEAVTSAV